MYLDNLVSAASTADVQVTYSEIMEDTLHMAETEAMGEMLLMKAEAAKHILGNEGPAEWWTKIKVVARKLFEMLKNLINKVFTFIKTIPQKVANVFRRIQLKWNKMGLESKYKNILKKNGFTAKQRAVEDLADRKWFVGFNFGLKINGFTASPKMLDVHKIKQCANDIAAAIDTYKQSMNNNSNKDAAEFAEIKAEADKNLESARNTVDDTFENSDEVEVKLFMNCTTSAAVIERIKLLYGFVRNNYIEKAASTAAREFEVATRNAATNAKVSYGEIEKAQRNDDDEKARASINALKGTRMCVAANASLSSKTVNVIIRSGISLANAVSAGFAVLKGGSTTANNDV